MSRYTAAHAHAEATSDYSYGDCESVQKTAQDFEDEAWNDLEQLSELLCNTPRGPLDFRLTGYSACTEGERALRLAQAWKAAQASDRPAIAAAFGARVLVDLETMIEQQARERAEDE